jgi:hypothetical protein
MRATVLRPRVVWFVALVLVALTLAASAARPKQKNGVNRFMIISP